MELVKKLWLSTFSFFILCISFGINAGTSFVHAQGTPAPAAEIAKPTNASKPSSAPAPTAGTPSKETSKPVTKDTNSGTTAPGGTSVKETNNQNPEKPANKMAWVKLCEKTPLLKKGEDGKEIKEEKNICLTHHERLDGNTGLVIVSAAIREVEGQDKKHLMVMVPLGMALPPGLRASVYTKEQWQKAEKNEGIDDKDIKLIELKYALCHAAGCTAEIEADNALIDQMKVGGGLMILAINAAAQPVGFPIPLEGFTESFSGKPVDNAEYKKARAQLMSQIRERQQQAMEKFKAEEMKKLPMDAPGAPTVTGSNPAKPKPEPKK